MENNKIFLDDTLTLLQDFVAASAAKFPQRNALEYHAQTFTYEELVAVSNKLAHYLLKLKLAKDVPLPLRFSNPVFYVIAILAVLKAGHFYLPLAASLPAERLALLLDQVNAEIILTEYALLPTFPGDLPLNYFFMNDLADSLNDLSTEIPDIALDASALCYMLFTSGSTGIPKGVLMEHKGPVNIIKTMALFSTLEPTDKFIQNVNFGFDPHVWTLFWPLAMGATVILQNEQEQHDVDYTVRLILNNSIRVLHAGGSLTKALLKHPKFSACQSLQQILGGGEAWSPTTLTELKKLLPACDIVNLYGPTETCIHATFWNSSNQAIATLTSVPIGKALPGYEVFILDEDLQEVQLGESGQIGIAGVGLARGYFQDSYKTAQKFATNPANPQQKLYLTGDLGKFNQDANLEFLGRVDEQVQIKGHRVEPGEIENTLMRTKKLTQATVLAEEQDGQISLIAFVEPKGIANDAIITELKIYLNKHLPGYMVPKNIIVMAALPLTANSKIDKKKLLAHAHSLKTNVANPSIDPESTMELIKSQWQQVLNLSAINDDDNFFQIGGDSLNALDIISSLNKTMHLDYPVSIIFDFPIFKDFVEYIENNNSNTQMNLATTDNSQSFPMSLNQIRLIKLASIDSAINNGIVPFQIKGTLNLEKLNQAAKVLASFHELLLAQQVDHDVYRFTHCNDAERPILVVHALNNDLAGILQHMQQLLHAPCDLTRDPLFAVHVYPLAHDDEHIVAIYLNHIIADAYSANLVNKQLFTIYHALCRDTQIDISHNPFSNYLAEEERFFAMEEFQLQESFWLNALAKRLRLLNFGLLEENDMRASFYSFDISEACTRAVKATASELKCSLFSILILAFGKAVYEYTEQLQFCIAFTYSLRDKPQYQNMVAPLSNKLLAPFDFSDASLSLDKRLEQLLTIYKYSKLQLETIQDKLRAAEGNHYAGLFNVLFDYERLDAFIVDNSSLAINRMEMPNSNMVKRHLSVRVLDNNQKLKVNMRFRSALFTNAQIQRLGLLFVKAIKEFTHEYDSISES